MRPNDDATADAREYNETFPFLSIHLERNNGKVFGEVLNGLFNVHGICLKLCLTIKGLSLAKFTLVTLCDEYFWAAKNKWRAKVFLEDS